MPGQLDLPHNGAWAGSVAEGHPLSAVFNQQRQAYVTQGQDFPDPGAQHLDIEAHKVVWRWLANANELRGDVAYVRVSDPIANPPVGQAADEDGSVSG